jgi:hypothetical protein
LKLNTFALKSVGSFMYLVKGISQPFGPHSRKSSGTTRTRSHSEDFAFIRVRYFCSYWSERPYCSTSTVTFPFEYFLNSGARAT